MSTDPRQHRARVCRMLCVEQGLPQKHVARAAGVSVSTVSRDVRLQGERARSGPRPRVPGLRRTVEVYQTIQKVAGHTSAASLARRFPDTPRSWHERMLTSYRRRLRRKQKQELCRLVWHRAGRAWAADHTHLEGRSGPIALNVRDLASGHTLAMEPVPDESERATLGVICLLIARHGAPLVLKLDNGPAFRSVVFKAVLAFCGVELLFSPPYCPSFNGACERGNRTVKGIARDLRTATSGRGPLVDYLEPATLIANRQPASRRDLRSRERIWESRSPMTAKERRAFAQATMAAEEEVRAEEGIAKGVRLPHLEHASITRSAITRTLLRTQLLTIRRG